MSKLLTEEKEFKIQERDKTYLKSFKFETSLPKLIIENSLIASEKIYDFSNCWRETFYIDAMAEESFRFLESILLSRILLF